MKKDQRHVRSMNRKCFFSLFHNLLLGWFSVYPLRFEPEQSVSLDLEWGEGRGGLDKGIVFMLCLRSIYTGTVDCQVSCLFYLKDFSLIVVS